MITVTNEVTVYEVDGEELPPVGKGKKIIVTSHWNQKQKVNIIFGGKKLTVLANDLRTAIENATNINRY